MNDSTFSQFRDSLLDKRTSLPLHFLVSIVLILFLTAFAPPPPAGPGHGRPKTQARPALSGPTLTYPTEHFVIHYTLDGQDAVSTADDNANELPDFVEAVATALERSWQREIEELGWRLPQPDEGEGGDTRLDVYLEDQTNLYGASDLYGYTDTFGGFIGDNPATPEEESHSAYGYLSLDNDYSPAQFGYSEISPLDAMRTTAAHEFNHAIQAAYDDNDPYAWLYEATAVWMEDEVYPEIGDARSYLTDYMDAPDICPLSVGRDDQDVRWYSGWILLRYLAEQSGGPETIRQLWQHLASLEGLAALEATLAAQKITLADLLVNFSVANLTKSDCPANAPYCYAQGSDYLRPYVEGSLRVNPGQTETFVPKDGVQQFGADYIRLKSDGPIRLSFQGSPAGDWQLRLVGLSGNQARVSPWPVANPITIDPSAFDKLYLVVVNTAPVEAEADCSYRNYALAAAAGQGVALSSAPPLPADPDPYVPPAYRDSSGAEVAVPTLSGGQPISPTETPFPPFYPGYLPAGYSLSGLVSYTLADLGEWTQAYAPGGGPILGLTYHSDSRNTTLTISQSPAPAQTLAAWVKDQDYQANDVRLVNNQPVHLVEHNHASSPVSVATFIHHDRFIVIEAPFDLIEVQQVVAGLLENSP